MTESIEGVGMGDMERLLDVRHKINEALEELSISDWISVEDRVPPYGEEVLVCSERYPKEVWKTHRVEGKADYIDSCGFIKDNYYHIPTHWHGIEKLEE